MWPNDKVLKFIEDYQACSCLWDVNCPDYKNRVKRKSAIESLAAKYEVSGADLEKKIHNLKTSFSRERKKCIPASGSAPKKSSWFAYDYLLFLPNVGPSSNSTRHHHRFLFLDFSPKTSAKHELTPHKAISSMTAKLQLSENVCSVDARRDTKLSP